VENNIIPVKTSKEIEIMTKAGKILSGALEKVCLAVKPGITELELDKIAEEYILSHGGEPGFKKVKGYKHTICAAANDVVVHGVPTKNKLKSGDIIGIDCGVYLKGFHTDAAETVRVSETRNKEEEDEIDRFIRIGKEALRDGIAQVKPGNRVGHISQAIQQKIEKEGGYSVSLSLVGHGVGRQLHEEPEVPGYLAEPISKTPRLLPGMTIAVEVIYSMGKPEVVYSGTDGWTIKTQDASLAGLFERTILVTPTGHKVLTPIAL